MKLQTKSSEILAKSMKDKTTREASDLGITKEHCVINMANSLNKLIKNKAWIFYNVIVNDDFPLSNCDIQLKKLNLVSHLYLEVHTKLIEGQKLEHLYIIINKKIEVEP